MLLALFSQTESHMVMPFSHGYGRKKSLGCLIVMQMSYVMILLGKYLRCIVCTFVYIYAFIYSRHTHYFYLINKLLGASSLEPQLSPSQVQSLYFCLLMHFTQIFLTFSHPQISCKILKRANSSLYPICLQCCMLFLLDPNTK